MHLCGYGSATPLGGGRIVRECAQAVKALIDKSTSIGVLLLCVVVLLILAGVIRTPNGGSAPTGRKARPREYIYLDSARVNSYLGQIDGGESTSEDLRETTASNLELKAGEATVGATASEGKALVKSLVVTKSEADKFSDLLGDLEAKESKEWLGELNVKAACKFVGGLGGPATLDGSIVLIKNAEVQVPPFMSVYPELRHVSYRVLPATPSRRTGKRVAEVFRAPPLTSFRAVDEAVRGRPKKEQKEFAKTVGANPRIPFSFTVKATAKQMRECKKEEEAQQRKQVVPSPLEPKAAEPKAVELRARRSTVAEAEAVESSGSGQAKELTVVLPARFADLTGDPSLLAVPLTIVGLVVDKEPKAFGDGTSVLSYWPALSVAKAPLLRELGVKSRYLKMGRVAQREQLFEALERSLTYEGPVVEIVPIAMYD